MTTSNAPSRASEALFAIGLALLLSHELDAVRQAEWQVLPLLRWLDDATGYLVFVMAHVPLFALILWPLAHRETIRFQSGRYRPRSAYCSAT